MRSTNRIAILEDGNEHEIFQDLSDNDFILIKNVRLMVPDQIEGKVEIEFVSKPKMKVTPMDDDWSKIKIRFNRPFWEIVRNKPFIITEDPNGFEIIPGEPIAKTKNTFTISSHYPEIEMYSCAIDCEEETWYEVKKIGNNQFYAECSEK
tara:strand:+ start:4736 stop:5185 length:450 start_codon:yes stop_codon:yes gene_type:complete